MLSRSLTRQASDWIMLKKQLAQFDEEYKWSQVGVIPLLFRYTFSFAVVTPLFKSHKCTNISLPFNKEVTAIIIYIMTFFQAFLL